MDRGKVWIADDFDAPDPELEALFYDAPIVTDSSDETAKKKTTRKKKQKKMK